MVAKWLVVRNTVHEYLEICKRDETMPEPWIHGHDTVRCN